MDAPDDCARRIENCYVEISARWPGIPVDVITPVWRSEFFNGSAPGARRLEIACAVRDQMILAGNRRGFSVYDGMQLSPTAAAGLADHCHPNDLGFQLYLMNLLKAMRGTRA